LEISGESPSLRPVTLITGASSGIGRELGRLAAKTDEVFLVARSADQLAEVAGEIHAAGGKADWSAVDLQQPGAADRLMQTLTERGLRCRRLVANAGIGFVGEAAAVPRERQLQTIQLNVSALTDLTLAVLPDMQARREGAILLVGSVAGFLPGPGMAVYYASKAYVQSLAEALRAELRPHGVSVCALSPGPVTTGFLAAATDGAAPAESSLFHVPAREVAEQAWAGLLAGRALIVPGWANRVVLLVNRLLPSSLMAGIIMRRQSARRPRRGV
jgi:uncharacterized protein